MNGPSEDEIREEQEHHIHSRTELNQQRGQADDDARAAARKRFGNRTRTFEETRGVYVRAWAEEFRKDMVYALRSFRRNPAVPITAIIVLALGIGSTAAVFSVVDRILFRALPYPDDRQLVSFGLSAPIEPTEFMLGPDYVEWRKAQTPFSHVASWMGVTACDLTEGSAQRLNCAPVDSSLLPALQIRPIHGRNFTENEDRPNAPRTAILSYALWKGRFGGDASIIDRTISLDGQPVRVVGVLPAEFELPALSRFDLLIPQQLRGTVEERGNMEVVRALARLKPGVTVGQAEQALAPLFQASLQNVPVAFRNEVKLRVRSLRDRQASHVRTASWLLLAAVGAVLAIACANIANLLLARTAARRVELTIRAALGASRTRLVRQLLTESLMLASIGGLLGLATAWMLLRLFIAAEPGGIPRLSQASLDLRVLLVTAAIAMGAGLLASVIPALQLFRSEVLAGGRSIAGVRGGNRLRQSLVVAQVAASVVLLIGSALLLRSVWSMQSAPLGFNADNAITVPVTLGRHGYRQPVERAQFFERLLESASTIPGISAVSLSDSIPPTGQVRAMIYSLIEVEGKPKESEGTGGMVPWRSVTPGFFSALEIPILRGRAFQERDRRAGEESIILGEGLARRLFGSEEPLGKRLRFGTGAWYTVVGIAAGISNSGLAPREPEYYLPRQIPAASVDPQSPEANRSAVLVIRSPWKAPMAEQWLRERLASVDPTVPISAEPLSKRVQNLAARPRFQAMVLTLFASLGLVLACVGLYGVISLGVAERTRETAIRLALGAAPSGVTGAFVGQALRWSLLGVAFGLIGSWFASRLMESLLFQTSPRDPVSCLAACAVLFVAAVAAAWIPARRATRIDPAVTLRAEG